MNLIDTHCHLDTIEPLELEPVLTRASKAHVTRMITIGASDRLKSASSAVEIAQQHSNIWASIGVHPHDAGSITKLDSLEELASHPKVLAIGETGLDFFRDWAPVEKQYELFQNTIAFAKSFKKPLIVHCRDALDETFDVLSKCKAQEVRGVFHCYSGDAEFALKLQDIGFLVSFTGNVTFKKAERIREAVRNIPLQQIMLETDTPYLAPEPYRGKKSEPKHVLEVAKCIADVKEITLEEVASTTSKTAEQFFGLEAFDQMPAKP